jgi:hypothetical protein
MSESLYNAMGRIASNIDMDLGYGAAMALHEQGKIDSDQFKMVTDFQRLEAEGYKLTGRQRNARSEINKQVLHSYTRTELVMDFGITWLDELSVAKNGWRYQPEQISPRQAKPKGPPPPAGYTPQVEDVPGYWQDIDIRALVLAAVELRQAKGTPPNRPSISTGGLPIIIGIPNRSRGGQIIGINEHRTEIHVVVMLDPTIGVALILPYDRCPAELRPPREGSQL